MSLLEIVRLSGLASVQDRGRLNYRHLGVSSGGALDEFGARVANLLVGNEPNAAVVECAFGSLTLRFPDDRAFAWCGGGFEVLLDGKAVPEGRAFRAASGDELVIGTPAIGCRLWIAVSGGIHVPVVLGSRSTDLRGRFGGLEGRLLRAGDQLPLASAALAPVSDDKRSAARPWISPARAQTRLRVVPGAEWSEFEADGFVNQTFRVSPEADRMGIRLQGNPVVRQGKEDLVSSPLAPGTVQVPPGGQPILLLNDCQTIGGYPKIAHVLTVDLPAAAQLKPGDELQFQQVTRAEAHELLLQRERNFQRFRIGLRL